MARPTIATITGGVTLGSTVDGTSVASASYTATANTLVVVVGSTIRGGGAAPTPTLTHAGNLTFTLSTLDDTSNVNITNGSRTRLWYAYAGSSPTAGILTLDTAGNTQVAWHLHVFEITNPHLTVPIIQAIVVARANSAGPTTATLGSAVLANSLIIAGWLSENGAAATITGPAGWDGLITSADTSTATPTTRQLEHLTDAEQGSAEFSTSASCDHVVWIAEFQEAESTTGVAGSMISGLSIRPLRVIPRT